LPSKKLEGEPLKHEEAKMAVLDDALVLEERAKKYYTDMGKQVTDPSAKKILELLANEEKKHIEALNQIKTGSFSQLTAPSLLNQVQGMVEGAVTSGQSTISTDASMRDVLQQAMEIEQSTERFYKEQAASLEESSTLRDLFESLAESEMEHYLLVSSLAEYFNRPKEWVEAAEFGLRPEY
jgi:rubrerythrin